MDREQYARLVFTVLVICVSLTQYVCRRTLAKRFPGQKKSCHIDSDYTTYVIPLWIAAISLYPFNFEWFAYTVSLPLPVRVVGAFLMAVSIPLSVWVYGTLGASFSAKLELMEGHRLVQKGPYARVRHPMYSTLFLCVIGSSLLSANMIVTASGALLVAGMLIRHQQEEAMLLRYFGNRYAEYRVTTGAFIPRFF